MTEELSGTRVLRDLPALDPYEQSLYDDLRNDRLGDRVRLEQERVQFQLVEEAVFALHHRSVIIHDGTPEIATTEIAFSRPLEQFRRR